MLVISQTLRHKKDYAGKRFAAMLADAITTGFYTTYFNH